MMFSSSDLATSDETNQGELVVDGITTVELELRLDLSVGAALPQPGGNVRGSGSPGAWHAGAARATIRDGS